MRAVRERPRRLRPVLLVRVLREAEGHALAEADEQGPERDREAPGPLRPDRAAPVGPPGEQGDQALLACGGAELGYARVRPARTYVRLMVGYDTAWALATLVGVLVAARGGTAGGEVWIGYQAVAPLLFAALLARAAPARLTPSAAS
ncbi:hypothetical protein [Streptomyces cinereoruber]|uniref:hypothetical protein n=1 Tax=Streptomyces cinereoruber TaxID=67260 RepID=UPI0036257863